MNIYSTKVYSYVHTGMCICICILFIMLILGRNRMPSLAQLQSYVHIFRKDSDMFDNTLQATKLLVAQHAYKDELQDTDPVCYGFTTDDNALPSLQTGKYALYVLLYVYVHAVFMLIM